MARRMVTIEGNTAVAIVAHATNEVIAIYPITPSSSMGEIADEMTAQGLRNIWGTVPNVTEMQSEAGAAAAVHGALTTGSLSTTLTASQGLLLMIPHMFKIAGELLPTVFHVSARSVACQALSIFGDHSDVMAVRSTGFALLSSNSVQEVMDFALIAQAASLESRIPFVHFFDGFRTSSETQKIEELSVDDFQAMINEDHVIAHRNRAMNPDRPVLRGSSQNPDVYFQGRETVNPYYQKTPEIVQKIMDKFAAHVGRQYGLFDYVGAPDAEHVAILMGSGAEAMHEVVESLAEKGEKVGVIKVRLYRPFSTEHFAKVLPSTVKKISVLDRTKEPGAIGEPLYLDIRTAVGEAMDSGMLKLDRYPVIVGGRYGLSSKEFTGGMAKAVLDNLKEDQPRNHFTIGIHDDVTHLSLPWDESFNSEPPGLHRAMFYGLGADGTVGANKNSIKIIGDVTDNYTQGYFVYDSKKAGAVTISHLRFGKNPIHSTYLVSQADFLACHNFSFMEKYDMLSKLKEGGIFLLASPYAGDEIWDKLPAEVQRQLIDKKVRFYVIDAIRLAKELRLGARINIIMQTAFFLISGILPKDQAMEMIKKSIKDTYGKKGEKIVEMNYKAAETAAEKIEEVAVPDQVTSTFHMRPPVPEGAPDFVKDVTAEIISGRGDQIPVSKMPVDGTFPMSTTQFEKRNIALDIPVWEPDVCIQCAQCSFVCPHAAIRMKLYDPKYLEKTPSTFKSADAKGKDYKGMKCTVQAAPEDCTGCGACVFICPARAKDTEGNRTEKRAINLASQPPLREPETENYKFFLALPEVDRALINPATVKGSQLLQPLFEYSGACAGCGETPYVKLMTQLFGDRAIIANATGCSSIYGGNLPTTPYCTREDGRGPTWNNSLFEDSAELAMGMRLTVDKHRQHAVELLEGLRGCKCIACQDCHGLFDEIIQADQSTLQGVEEQRARIAQLQEILKKCDETKAKLLSSIAGHLVKRSVWGFGGDGWAYDIGYGGLDHVVASGKNVNLLVLDTEVYSNTGGQASKATPLGAVAKFAAGGKPIKKKDLGLMCMSYGHVYVAQVSMGSNPAQTVKAFAEAESYEGPSIIIAYSHCIAHGIDMSRGLDNNKLVVDTGAWILYRYNPALAAEGKNPLVIDSKPPSKDIGEYLNGETRFRTLRGSNPEMAEAFIKQARKEAAERYNYYTQLAKIDMTPAAPASS